MKAVTLQGRERKEIVFELKACNLKNEYELYKEIWSACHADPWKALGLIVKTPMGTFENRGGFNHHPFDFWLYKKGTDGCQRRSFWRVCIGNKKEFKVILHDFRYGQVEEKRASEIAEKIGAKVKIEKDRGFSADPAGKLSGLSFIYLT